MSKKILFFGNERLATGVHSGVSTLQALLTSGYEVAAIVVAQAETAKSRKERQLEVSVIAAQYNIPLLSPADLLEARGQLAGFGAEAAVLIAYGKIVPSAILDLFPRGIINIHPSLLPLHRGPTPIENAILNGDTQTGVSLMRLSAHMDTGPVYAQQVVHLKGDETKQGLANQLSAIGVDMVLEYLPKVLDGSAQPKPQDETGATYDHLIHKTDGQLDWTKPAARLEREVRAYAGWPRSRARLGSTDVIITGSRVQKGRGEPGAPIIDSRQLGVGCGENILVIDSLIPAGKKEMSGAAFLAGYKIS
ncbi:MAG TPA: methionyl-tRNA formyltransferase [Candidatus Dormibacteraeota bacterium]|nr:methionyl-tRNA formyltransferase [Candidatus Dormibacteraeota bacterium]